MELIASYWAIAGDRFPGDGIEISPFKFEDRMEAAGRIGFRGAGFVHAEIMHQAQRIGLKTVKSILDDNQIINIEFEALIDWFTDGDRRKASDRLRRDFLQAGEAIGARHLKVLADMEGKDWPIEHLASEFSKLCQDAAQAGMMIALETMPWSNLNTIRKTLEVTRMAGQPNGGVLVDIWHLVRGGVSFEEITLLKADEIISVEIDDALPDSEESLWDDTIHNRLLCGQGSFDIGTFMEKVIATGYSGPVGLEIISKSHRKLPMLQAIEETYEAARRYVPV